MGKANTILFSLFLGFPFFSYPQNRSFLAFDVRPADNGAVLIQWNVNQAADTLSFELQKSSDRKNWKIITRVNPLITHQYSYIDPSVDSLTYYRVGQAGSGTNVSFTQARWVQVSKSGKFYIWPNPARDILHLKTSFDKGSIDVINAGGKHLIKMTLRGFMTDISTVRLAIGIYLLEIKHEKEIFVGKFIKE